MRKTGECGLNKMAQAKWAKRLPAEMKRRCVQLPCTSPDCSHVDYFSEVAMRKLGIKNGKGWREKWKCKDCHAREKKEFNQAIISLARRKGLVK